MMEMYESDQYEQNNPDWHEQDSPWKASKIETMIRRHNLPVASICEIGCGTGEILLNLERSFPDTALHGYEVAPRAFERAVAKESDRTNFFLEDALDRQDLHFDVVMAIDVIEHVEDYLGFLKRMRTIGQYKIFHIPLDLSAQSVARSWPIMNLRAGVGHIHYFTKDLALAALESCGYEIVDHFYTASRLELPNQAWSSRAMRLPRRMASRINPDVAVRVLGGYSLLVLAR